MGLISRIFGGGGIRSAADAVTDVAEVFRPNATRQMELGHEAFVAALDQHGTEFAHGRHGWFDRLMNGLNRLPRPFLALGTLGLFVYAMVDPLQFAERMRGLAYVPDPLWWLLGAIVSFYFGAREMHYLRSPASRSGQTASDPSSSRPSGAKTIPTQKPTADRSNPALEAWRAKAGR